MNLYELFILGVNIKYVVFSILYRHINVPTACKELKPLKALCPVHSLWPYPLVSLGGQHGGSDL